MDDRSWARRLREPRAQLGVSLFERFGRIWLLAGVIVVAGVVGGRRDGLAAAIIIFVAYTIPFVIGLIGPPPSRAERHHPDAVARTADEQRAKILLGRRHLAARDRVLRGSRLRRTRRRTSPPVRSRRPIEFKLDTWFSVGPIDFNKGVLYLMLTAAITIGMMLYMAERLKQRPGRLQVAVEMFYDLIVDWPTTWTARWSRKYFPLIATIFVFILVTNLIGYIPLPINTAEKFSLFGVHFPSFQIYAADTNVAFPLILALGGVRPLHLRGDQARTVRVSVKSLMPGVSGPIGCLDLPIEILSYFLRLISLTVRLWANLLAGHLLIAFMGGELGVLSGRHGRVLGAAADRGRDLPVRGDPDRRPAGIHLFDPDRHLSR